MTSNAGFTALRSWLEQAGERPAGESREIYLQCDSPRDTWVVELQLALEQRTQPPIDVRDVPHRHPIRRQSDDDHRNLTDPTRR